MKTEWISVKDRLPDEDCIVDVWMPEYDDTYKRVPDVQYNARQKIFYIEYDFIDITNDVTHWMPLPEQPKIETEEQK